MITSYMKDIREIQPNLFHIFCGCILFDIDFQISEMDKYQT
jgi:hypothetical protein